MERLRKIISAFFVCTLLFTTGCTTTKTNTESSKEPEQIETSAAIDYDGIYDDKDNVALYIYTYHELPSNYMTKEEAREYGWEGGALSQVVEGMCIGGDVYGNYEGTLPEIDGTYYECDIDTLGKKKRGAKRIIYSDTFDIYYTDDHYESFLQLYEGE